MVETHASCAQVGDQLDRGDDELELLSLLEHLAVQVCVYVNV